MPNTIVRKLERLLFLFCILCLGCCSVYGQATFVSSHNEASGSSGRLSYSVGQSYTIQSSGTQGSTISGMQQPFAIYTLGVNEKNSKIKVTVFPNPVSRLLILKADNSKQGIREYELYDAKGSLKRSKQIAESETLIDMSDFQSATYILKVIDEGKVVKSFKIIKQ